MSHATPHQHATLTALMVAAGVLGMTAVWGTAAVMTGRPLGWMAILTAADLALLARLAGAAPGRPRALLVVSGLALTVAASLFLLAAGLVGTQMGLSPLQSAPRLSLDLAWLVVVEAQGTLDVAALVASAGLAWWWAR